MRISDWSSDVCSSDLGMAGLVGLHRGQDCAAAQVGAGQGLQVFVQVRLDLALGLDHEAQVPAVAAQAGHQADGVAAGVQDGVSSEERRVGKESVSPCRSRRATYN